MKIKACVFVFVIFFISVSGAGAQNTARPGALLLPYMETAPDIGARAAVLMDAVTGTVLYAKNPDEQISPASLTKLMTMHLALNEVARGNARLDELIPVGVESWAQSQPRRSSLMYLAPGQIVNLKEILLGLAVPSGNDAAVAVSLRFAPTTGEFAGLMNREAARLGLTKTHFVEPSGISENNMTTAGEFAFFCREYITEHPESLKEFHSVNEFAYPKAENVAPQYRDRPGTISQTNHNNLLKTFPGVDGLKTGYIDEAGYNIALTASRNGTRFIAVILGAPARGGGERIRDEAGTRLLSWGFDTFKTIRPEIGTIESARLWKGRQNFARLKIDGENAFTVPARRAASLYISTEVNDPLVAPLPAAYRAGDLVLSDEQGELRRVPLLTAENYEQGGFFKRIIDSVRLFFKALLSR
jgi:D-alanyl-D-alanine carboxypeptidase (penicillin-binding protein 5/6)